VWSLCQGTITTYQADLNQTWLWTVESNVAALNIGLTMSCHWAQNHRAWWGHSWEYQCLLDKQHDDDDDDDSEVFIDASLFCYYYMSGRFIDNYLQTSATLQLSHVYICVERPSSPWLLSASLTSQPRSIEVMWLADFNGRISKFNIYATPVVEGNWHRWTVNICS